jgi:hypothetical protein
MAVQTGSAGLLVSTAYYDPTKQENASNFGVQVDAPYTFSFWVKLPSLPPSGTASLLNLATEFPGGNTFLDLRVDSGGGIYLGCSALSLSATSAGGKFSAGSWHNITVTTNWTFGGYSGGIATYQWAYHVYVDGVEALSGSPSGQDSYATNWWSPMVPSLGDRATTGYFANLSAWQSILGSGDISALCGQYPSWLPVSATPFYEFEFSPFGAQTGLSRTAADGSWPATFYPLVVDPASGAVITSLGHYTVGNTGASTPFVLDSPPRFPLSRSHKRVSYAPRAQQYVGATGTFTSVATASVVGGRIASASGSAVFTASASEHVARTKAASDAGTIAGSASGFVRGLKQRPSSFGAFADVVSVVVVRQRGSVGFDTASFSAMASGVTIGDKSVTASSGARFFDRALSGGTWSRDAADSAEFNDQLTLRGILVFAIDTATFHGSSIGRSPYHASDSASFSDRVLGGLPTAPSAFSEAVFSDSAISRVPAVHVQRVQDSFRFLFTLATARDSSRFVVSSDIGLFSEVAESGGMIGYAVAATDGAFVLIETAQATFQRAYTEAPPGTKGRFGDTASAVVLRLRHVAATDSFRFADLTSSHAESLVSCVTTDIVAVIDLATEKRTSRPSATDSAKASGSAASKAVRANAAADSAAFSDVAAGVVEKNGAASTIVASDRADASVMLAGGVVIPGGDQSPGLRMVLWPAMSPEFPASFAESAEGVLVAATGVDPVIAWDGVASSAWQAGLSAPGSAVWMDGDGVGPIMGKRYAYVRWIDVRGNPSNLSQASDPLDLGGDGFVEDVTYSDTQVIVRSTAHGLSTGTAIRIGGVSGLPVVNGQWTITAIDADSFSLDGLVLSGGSYAGGGVWSAGVASVVYSNVPVPDDPKVARRQILRNLAGNASVFYVDIDTTDLSSTSFTSSRTDEQLAACVAVPMWFSDPQADEERLYRDQAYARRTPAANRYGLPPSWKCSLVAYSGRIWAAADRVYRTGNVSVTLDSVYVIGLGTNWSTALAGRLLYVDGADPRPIASVIVESQILVLETPYEGPSQVFAFYSIRPSPVERLLVYYSEPHLPEAWPPWNAFSVPETSDEITALFALKSFLYVAKERNLYKFAFREDPGRDGYAFPVARRGCVNERCFVPVEDACFILDEAGIYRFEKDQIDPISQDVQVLFKADSNTPYRIDWTTDRTLWHALHDPSRETVRWFVDFVGHPSLTMAVCYDYRRGFWWLERYPEAVTSSSLCVVSGYRQPTIGTTGRRVFCLGQGTLDGIAEGVAGTLAGTVTSADSLSLTDSNASFPSNLAGVPVAVIMGDGTIQSRVVSSNTSTTIVPVEPWDAVPDASASYQVGGVPWTWRSGWRRIADDEAENPRDLEFVFQPTRSTSSFGASLYYDHSQSPQVWPYDMDRDGISVKQDSTAITVDATSPRGYAIQRMSGHRDPYGFGNRYVSLELNGVQGLDPQRIFEIVINGAR